MAGEYPYVLARKVWLYPFWAGRWPPNRSNLLPPWLEGDRLDRTTGAAHWVRTGCAVVRMVQMQHRYLRAVFVLPLQAEDAFFRAFTLLSLERISLKEG